VPNELPLALRPLGEFPATSTSVFDDPGDEKSWHRSQGYDSLKRFYVGREPAWYRSALRPLAGARRVVDLGAGPGLALRELLEMGAETVLGVDRWPGFAADSDGTVPIALHDLTLPMPFLASGSFDAVLSHYALDYVSPIGMRQVLREAHRILEPGGRLLIYIAAVGLGSGDDTRTIPYDVAAMTALLHEAGFVDLDVVASPNGRNTVAQGVRGPEALPAPPSQDALEVDVAGETQLSTAFALSVVDAAFPSVTVEVRGTGRSISLHLLPQPDAVLHAAPRLSVCVRVVDLGAGRWEVQAWVWRGDAVMVAEATRIEFAPTSLRIRARGEIEHVEHWTPGTAALEVRGSAYAPAGSVEPGDQLTEAQRGAEGRLLLVPVPGETLDPATVLGPGRNRFWAHRLADGATPDVARLQDGWQAGHLHALVASVDTVLAPATLDARLWAARRQVPLLIEGPTWAALSAVPTDLGAPTVLVDPVLTGADPGPVADEVAARAAGGAVYLLLDAGTPQPGGARVLPGGSPDDADPIPLDNLRYLTERTLLMRLRQDDARAPEHLGRRPPLSVD